MRELSRTDPTWRAVTPIWALAALALLVVAIVGHHGGVLIVAMALNFVSVSLSLARVWLPERYLAFISRR